jgi:hypothetical protein
MPTYSSYNVLGSSIEAGEITSGTITPTQLSAEAQPWQYIERITISTTGTIFDFTSIATGFTSFLLIGSVIVDGTTSEVFSNMAVTFNGDTGANYDWQYLKKASTTVSASVSSNQSSISIGEIHRHNTVDCHNGYFAVIQNNTASIKQSVLSQYDITSGSRMGTVAGVWDDTSNEIDQITVTSPYTLNAGSYFVLYGRDD